MDELETLNKPVRKSFFDRNCYEEDVPVEISQLESEKYESLERMFENVCQDITIEKAGVTIPERRMSAIMKEGTLITWKTTLFMGRL